MVIAVHHADSFVPFVQVLITVSNVKMDIEQKLVLEHIALPVILDVKLVRILHVHNVFGIGDS